MKGRIIMEEKQVVFVTGGSRGIGKEVALKYAENGYNVVINYVSDKTDVEALSKEFLDKGAESLILKADVSKTEEVENVVNKAIEKFGKIDVLVNNAGITRDTLLMRMKEEDFDKVIEINLKGTFVVTKAVVPFMMKKRSGRIINVSSVVGVTGNGGQCNYSASKAGIIGFTKSLARELSSRNIRANAVAPGFIATDMTEVLSDTVKESINASIPMKRMGSAREVANVIYFLGSEESSYITGQVINIDGGMVM
jgi:3-oxoacyl-[acyl-carrier protein] reductase